MKQILIGLVLVAVLIAAGVTGRLAYVEMRVTEYLIEQESIPEESILVSDSFIANLPGARNWMVAIKLKDDARTYYYYSQKGQVYMESYTENGIEYVQ
ncbi:hypothetical protein CF394_09055 [Tetzosporium hominis]|uniref:DUF3139 domain-containing protein n=1 Tax=Tetzosporium hominis TaxID=2020506 RepID=A0A264W2T1_9BACL|nr:hypothetical protein [Tetzosporium hominis]OZS77893.1 hypothetical protein CF394_09055 [Tetzosporium hominis]